ncbi:MAG: hypothetical protein KatS3mg105_2540 [Gemmatales bacterium]|nr:MAG: hypothetical protein KatS3mg105_2540 [Gemmatales bacterium]
MDRGKRVLVPTPQADVIERRFSSGSCRKEPRWFAQTGAKGQEMNVRQHITCNGQAVRIAKENDMAQAYGPGAWTTRKPATSSPSSRTRETRMRWVRTKGRADRRKHAIFLAAWVHGLPLPVHQRGGKPNGAFKISGRNILHILDGRDGNASMRSATVCVRRVVFRIRRLDHRVPASIKTSPTR